MENSLLAIIEEHSSRRRSTAWLSRRVHIQHMVPQCFEDPVPALLGEFSYDLLCCLCLLLFVFAGRAVAVNYMQRWPSLLLSTLELEILCHSPTLLFYATVYIVIGFQDEPM